MLATIAFLYEEICAAGNRHPSRKLYEQLKQRGYWYSRDTVRHLVAEARRQGFLTEPPSQRRSGGHANAPGAERRFLSPQEIADIVGLHPTVIRRAIDRGELRAHKVCGRLRISREAFQEWLDRCLVRT